MARRLGFFFGTLLAIAFAIWMALGLLISERRINLSDLEGNAARGEYVLRVGGCVACHTQAKDGAFLAGGDPIATPFGKFVAPNITPDPTFGIGTWGPQDFANSLINGRSPDGAHHYPVFPYTSYSSMSAQDIADLWAYLRSVSPVAQSNDGHTIKPFYLARPLLRAWKALAFRPAEFEPDPNRSALWNRGAYLVTGPGHCGECHTPRDGLGRLDRSRQFQGAILAPKGEKVPPLTTEILTREGWQHDDLLLAFQYGILPDGDVMGGSMGEVIDGSLGFLSEEDLLAMATFLLDPRPLDQEH